MFFSIDPANGIAIYEQIVRQVKFAVADNTLRPGQLLPSIRVLSQQIAVNPNTLNRAFQQLQADGVLESIRGRGLAVCDAATQGCIESRREILSARFKAVISEALHAGIDAKEIRSIVQDQLTQLVGQVETISSTAKQPDESPAS